MIVRLVSISLIMSFLFGCAATRVAIEKRNLDVKTKMSNTIFLDPVGSSKKTVFIQAKNTSDKQDLEISSKLAEGLTRKGYKIMDDPDLAYYILQVNILQAGKIDPTAAKQALATGFGGALAGAAIGYAANGTGRSLMQGGIIGGAIGGAASFLANSLVKDVTFSLMTDIQLSEKSKSKIVSSNNQNLSQGNSGSIKLKFTEELDRKKYRTRILSTANKVNLKFEKALPELEKGLVNSISGLF